MYENRTRLALKTMAQEDPELAARLVLQTLPGASRPYPGQARLRHGCRGARQLARGGRRQLGRRCAPATDGDGNGKVDFRLKMDPRTLADLASGAGPLGLMLSGRLHIQGKRRRALRLRALAGAQPTMAEVVRGARRRRSPVPLAPYLIDPRVDPRPPVRGLLPAGR